MLEIGLAIGMNRRIANVACPGSLSRSLLLLALAFAPQLHASNADELLSSPLSLERALSLADDEHPELALADANLALAKSQRLEADTHNDLDAYFELAPYTAVPSTNDHFMNDSYLRLSVTKTLYDFGYSEQKEASAEETVKSQQLIVSVIKIISRSCACFLTPCCQTCTSLH